MAALEALQTLSPEALGSADFLARVAHVAFADESWDAQATALELLRAAGPAHMRPYLDQVPRWV